MTPAERRHTAIVMEVHLGTPPAGGHWQLHAWQRLSEHAEQLEARLRRTERLVSVWKERSTLLHVTALQNEQSGVLTTPIDEWHRGQAATCAHCAGKLEEALSEREGEP